MDFCGLWLVSAKSLKSGGDDDAAELGGHVRCQGSADDWANGIYKASTGQYSENELPGALGGATGTPEQGIDETLILYAGPRTGN